MYELRCLGEATLRTSGGELVHFRSRKHLALLIYLALNADRAHRRERLASMLWSDSDEPRARHSLSQALYAVRRLLEGSVRIEGDDLEIDTNGLYVDVLELERHLDRGQPADAADLFRGDFLEGFWVRGARGYEQWVFHERARLSALARDALRQAIKTAHDRCDWTDVRSRAERLVGLEPFDEQAYAELMRALWMLGDRAAALDRYEGLKRILADELQASPSKETEALAQRIRQRPVRGGWNSRSLLREPDSALFVDPPFVGRKHELSVLAQQWRIVATGESRTVALVGSAGIGKTRLATEFIKSLELEDVTVLRGRCYEAEQSLPYGPIAEALRQSLDKLDLSDVYPLWLAELARIVPEVHEKFDSLPIPSELDAEGGRRRLFEGIAQVFRSGCEESPLLLFLDDLHWADESSEALLHYLRRRVTNGLYALVAYRPEELLTSSKTQAGMVSIDDPDVRILPVNSLEDADSRGLLIELLGNSARKHRLSTVHRLSTGNPFFAIQLARSLSEDRERFEDNPSVPGSIRSLLDRRLSRLSDRATAMVQQAAVLGTRVGYHVLSKATGLPALEVDVLFREIRRLGIMCESGEFIAFGHDLIREVAASHIPYALRRNLHFRAANALIDTNSSPAEIAYHYSAAEERQKAQEWAVRGANAAEDVFALEEAADLLELAIQYSPSPLARSELMRRLGKLYCHLRKYEKARPLLQQHLDYVKQHNDHSMQLFSAKRDRLFVDVYSSKLPPHLAAESLQELFEELDRSDLTAEQLRAELLSSLFWASARSLNPALVEQTIRKIQALHNHTSSPDVRWRTSRCLGIYHSYKGDLDTAESVLREAIDRAREVGNQAAVLECYVGLTTILPRTGSTSLATEIVRGAGKLAEQLADPGLKACLYCNCAVPYLYSRDLPQAEQYLSYAQKILSQHDSLPDVEPSVLFNLGYLWQLRGGVEEAKRCWLRALNICERSANKTLFHECLSALGLVALGSDNISSARTMAAKALRYARRGKFLLDNRFMLEELLARLRKHSGHKEKGLRRLASIALVSELRDIPLYIKVQLTRVELLLDSDERTEAVRVFSQMSRAVTSSEGRWAIAAGEELLAGREELN